MIPGSGICKLKCSSFKTLKFIRTQNGCTTFITMSYKTKSEQSECKIHDPMIYACGCGERDIPFFIRTPLGMIGIPTLKFLKMKSEGFLFFPAPFTNLSASLKK